MKKIVLIASLLTSSCVMGTYQPDIPRIERDIHIACQAWNDAKIVAVLAGLFVPGVSSASVILAGFVDPICNGTVQSALTDPTTAEWIRMQADKLRGMMNNTGLRISTI